MYTKSIESYATDVLKMEDRAICSFRETLVAYPSQIEIVKSNVKRLVRALAKLDDDTNALLDYYVQKAVWIGEKYGDEDCKVLSERIEEISIEQHKKEQEEMQRREDMELLQDILSEKPEDLCEEDIDEMYRLKEKYDEFLTEEQQERFMYVHLTLCEIAEDKETALANELYNQMLEESEEQYDESTQQDKTINQIDSWYIEENGVKIERRLVCKVVKEEKIQGEKYIPCDRCDGKGILNHYHYISLGRCFKCDGTGRL